MANPMALNYANDTIEGDNPSVSYATVYPVCMFLRVIGHPDHAHAFHLTAAEPGFSVPGAAAGSAFSAAAGAANPGRPSAATSLPDGF